mgnify:CR=1 FL=1
MLTAISNVRIFDGEQLLEARTIVFDQSGILAIGGEIPADAQLIDGQGATLLPGLIDAHTHTDLEGLRNALQFGVTTELEMMGHWTAQERHAIAERDDVADV